MSVSEHGGDVDRAVELFGGTRADWLDLSTGINPRGYASGDIPPSAFACLPSPTPVETVARAAFGVPDDAEVVAAAGVSALIQQVPRLYETGRCAVLGPTYSEHTRALASSGWAVFQAQHLGETKGYDLVVLANPNNPDGRRHDPGQLAEHEGPMIIDESFVDTDPSLTAIDQAGRPDRLIFRSFGKFHGLAGIRLGFAILNPVPAERLRVLLGPWPVSGPAVEIGCKALVDQGWRDSTRVCLEADASRLDGLLQAAGLKVLGGTCLFRLIEVDDAAALQRRLAERRIWTRVFPYSRTWMRLGLPGDEAGWQRLEAALAG